MCHSMIMLCPLIRHSCSHLLLLLSGLCLVSYSTAHLPSQGLITDAGQLLPGVPRSGEVVQFIAQTNVYSLQGIKPGASYEVRVSHPSWIPATLSIRLQDKQSVAGWSATSARRSRKLLDCDKIIFSVAPDLSVQGHPQPVVLVSAVRRGVHRGGDSAGPQQLIYNIVLQGLALGIPTDAFPVVVTLCCGYFPGGSTQLYLHCCSTSRATRIRAIMNQDNLSLTRGLVSPTYINQGGQSLASRHNLVKALLANRRLPEQGWDEATIEMFVQDCALMDSNNFRGNVGVGEREGRVACGLVARRHFRLSHGIGRSGDIAAEQPKAAGSSLLAKLTTLLTADALRLAGLGDLGLVTVLPVATGLAMTLTLMAIKATRPASARYVIWSRVDQKTCLKAITAAGLEVRVIELQAHVDELRTDVEAISATIQQLGPEAVCAVVTTTSCFAPRACDDVVAVAKLCQAAGVPHMINNAYGVQSSQICKLVTSAWRKGRVDAVVQSTDKNFMVPVGGAVVIEGVKHVGVVQAVNTAYPGRASMGPHLDLLLTLLHWGKQGWLQVLADREQLYEYTKLKLEETAAALGQRVLETPGNPISLGVTLDQGPLSHLNDYTFLGSKLWARFVSGTRVIAPGKQQSVSGISFQGYGSHCDAYPHAYLTAAAALGGSKQEVDEFCVRLSKCLKEAAGSTSSASKGAVNQQAASAEQGAVAAS